MVGVLPMRAREMTRVLLWDKAEETAMARPRRALQGASMSLVFILRV